MSEIIFKKRYKDNLLVEDNITISEYFYGEISFSKKLLTFDKLKKENIYEYDIIFFSNYLDVLKNIPFSKTLVESSLIDKNSNYKYVALSVSASDLFTNLDKEEKIDKLTKFLNEYIIKPIDKIEC